MSDVPSNEGLPNRGETRATGQISYPTNSLIAVLDTPEQVERTVTALTSGGFLASEIQVTAGSTAAHALNASTGRSGILNLAVRIAETFGYANAEMQVRESAERALHDGHFLMTVAAAGDERKDAAARILQANGAHSVAYLGRFTVEHITPPRAD